MYSIHGGGRVPGLRCMLHSLQTDHCLSLRLCQEGCPVGTSQSLRGLKEHNTSKKTLHR